MNTNSHDCSLTTKRQLSPEDLQHIYTLYLDYMQLQHANSSSESNAVPEIG